MHVKKSGTQKHVEIIPKINVDQNIVDEKLSVKAIIKPPIIAPNARPKVSINEPIAIIVPRFSGRFTSIRDEYQLGAIPKVKASPTPSKIEKIIHKIQKPITSV
ncbi:MAG: hypothetical protein CEE43_13315 [Promethearchaeota archaeon Loki_b32]|nr:MAG: hypothetical protein CEE43_13315 [Candidatus Lokiarchaeota archaeon Loki_b32]